MVYKGGREIPSTSLCWTAGPACPHSPKRLVIVWTPNGTVMDRWWPEGGSPDAPLGPILAPLEPFRDRLSLLRGVDMESAYIDPIPPDHVPDIRNALTGRQPELETERWIVAGESVDQHIASAIGGETRYASVELGVQPRHPMSYRGRNQVVSPVTNPEFAWIRFFGESSDLRGVAERLRLERRSILDITRTELDELSAALPGDERALLDAHLESVRELERSLEDAAGASVCEVPPLDGLPLDHKAPANFPAVGRMLTDMLAMTLACDLTRVATLQWSGEASPVVHTQVDVDSPHHRTAHYIDVPEEEAIERLTRIETWYAEQLAHLLGRLDAMPEGDGSVLDHSLVVWAHEQSHGATHLRRDMPYVLVGGCNGAIPTGLRLDLGGVPHNQLLVTLCQVMDVPTQSFGDPRFGSGGLVLS